MLELRNRTDKLIPAGVLVYIAGQPGPGEELVVDHYNEGDKEVTAHPAPIESQPSNPTATA